MKRQTIRIFLCLATFPFCNFSQADDAKTVDVDAELTIVLGKIEPPCLPNLAATLSKFPFNAIGTVKPVQPIAKVVEKRTGACKAVEGTPGKVSICLSNDLAVESQKKGTTGNALGLFGKYAECPFKIGIISIADPHQFEEVISSNVKCKTEFAQEFSDVQKHPYFLKSSPQVEFAHHFATSGSKSSSMFEFEIKSARAATARIYQGQRPDGIFIRSDYRYATKVIQSSDKVVFMTSSLAGTDLGMTAGFYCKLDKKKVEELATILLSAPKE